MKLFQGGRRDSGASSTGSSQQLQAPPSCFKLSPITLRSEQPQSVPRCTATGRCQSPAGATASSCRLAANHLPAADFYCRRLSAVELSCLPVWVYYHLGIISVRADWLETFEVCISSRPAQWTSMTFWVKSEALGSSRSSCTCGSVCLRYSWRSTCWCPCSPGPFPLICAAPLGPQGPPLPLWTSAFWASQTADLSCPATWPSIIAAASPWPLEELRPPETGTPPRAARTAGSTARRRSKAPLSQRWVEHHAEWLETRPQGSDHPVSINVFNIRSGAALECGRFLPQTTVWYLTVGGERRRTHAVQTECDYDPWRWRMFVLERDTPIHFIRFRYRYLRLLIPIRHRKTSGLT